jgi:histidinol-phosphatase (PHP family)
VAVLADYHVHTSLSADGRGSPREMCLRAVELGLREVAFTEHLDAAPGDPSYMFFDYDAARRAVEDCRREFAGALAVRFGVEMDYQPHIHDVLARIVENGEFDLVVGSSHYIRGEMGWFPEVYRRHDERWAYEGYFEGVLALARSGLADVVAHLDLVKRYAIPQYGPCDRSRWAGRVEEILVEMVRRGLALELNTSGLRQAPKETFPDEATVRRFRELGGRLVTVGSDCHGPEDLGGGFAEAEGILSRAGFGSAARFEGRRAVIEESGAARHVVPPHP